VKTGRLLKFHRRDADVHAYHYPEGAQFKAAIYVIGRQAAQQLPAEQELVAGSSQLVEDEVRAWVDDHFPR
jgi:hypothetical protein